MPNGIRNAHAMLPEPPEASVPVRVVRRQHASVAGAHHLAGMKRETRYIAKRLADLPPQALNAYLTADGAGCVLYDGKAVLARQGHDRFHVARHTHLMDA